MPQSRICRVSNVAAIIASTEALPASKPTIPKPARRVTAMTATWISVREQVNRRNAPARPRRRSHASGNSMRPDKVAAKRPMDSGTTIVESPSLGASVQTATCSAAPAASANVSAIPVRPAITSRCLGAGSPPPKRKRLSAKPSVITMPKASTMLATSSSRP